MLIMVLMLMLLLGIISAGVRLAWNMTKFIFGLGLFWFCPLLFILVILFGAFSHMWLPIVIIGLLLGGGFSKA